MGREEQGVSGEVQRYVAVPRTLCFVERQGPDGPEVLLLRGAADKRLWAGQYNGVGGHVERGEDIYHAARRELVEETGLAISHLRLRAVIHIDAGAPRPGILVFVFTAWTEDGSPRASEEGSLHWVPRHQALSLHLVEDLRDLLPRLWSQPEGAPPFYGRYRYDNQDRLVMEWFTPHDEKSQEEATSP